MRLNLTPSFYNVLLLTSMGLFTFGSSPISAYAESSPTAQQNALSSIEEPIKFVEFILEDEANCQSRESQHVIVHNIHPKRSIRVWLDRFYRNVPTGDRSRSDLPPGGEPEGLGCATVMNAKQEWRVVKAIFLD